MQPRYEPGLGVCRPRRFACSFIGKHYQLSLICRHLFTRLQPPKFPENVSELAKNFLSNCLIIDPDGRMKAAELLQHAVSQLPLFVRNILQTYDAC